MKILRRCVLLLAIIAVVASCAHLKPVADTDPPKYEDSGKPGILDWLAQIFWPRSY